MLSALPSADLVPPAADLVASADLVPPAAQGQTGRNRVIVERSTKSLVEAFLAFGMSPEQAKAMDYKQMIQVLRNPAYLEATKRCLKRILLLCAARHGMGVNLGTINIREFNTTYMIALKPLDTFEALGGTERTLVSFAQEVLTQFHAILDGIAKSETDAFGSLPAELTGSFRGALSDFLAAFKPWKAVDEGKLIGRIERALSVLYQANAQLPPDLPESSTLKEQFRVQTQRLKAKFEQLAGAEAVRAFEAAEEARRSAELVQPPSPLPAGLVMGLPPLAITKGQLVHELLLNPNFQLGMTPGELNPVLEESRASFQEAFWDRMHEELAAEPPVFGSALRLLERVCDAVKHIACPDHASELCDRINLDGICAKILADQFAWEDRAALIQGVCSALVRVQEAQEQMFTESGEAHSAETRAAFDPLREALSNALPEDQTRLFVKGLRFILDVTNTIRIDASNQRLRFFSPALVEHGFVFEQDRFKEGVRNGSIDLQKTRSALKEGLRFALQCRMVALGGVLQQETSACRKVHVASLLQVASKGTAPSIQEACPEELRLDLHRLVGLGAEIIHIAQCAGMLHIASDAIRDTVEGIVVRSEVCDIGGSLAGIFNVIEESSLMDIDGKNALMEALASSMEPCSEMHAQMVDEVLLSLYKLCLDGLGISAEASVPVLLRPWKDASAELVHVQLKPLESKLRSSAAVFAKFADLNWRLHGDILKGFITEAASGFAEY